LRVFETYKHLSVIAGMTPSGQLYSMIRDGTIKAIKCVAFLKHLLCFVSNRLLVIWDGSPIHRAEEVKWFLSSRSARGLQLERLPAYPPDLNPAEGIWQYLKNVELRNLCCDNTGHLHRELTQALVRLRAKPDLVRKFIGQTGLE